jgi:hypothetical protein
MKRNLLVFILVVASLGLNVSCKKPTDPNTNNNNTTVTNSFTANLGGSWTATTITGSVYSSDYINVKGIAADGSYLQVTMPIGITAGTYNIGAGTQNTIAYTSPTGGYSGAGGSLVITSNSNNVIKGSWSGCDLQGSNSSIPTIGGTSGTFVAKYQ